MSSSEQGRFQGKFTLLVILFTVCMYYNAFVAIVPHKLWALWGPQKGGAWGKIPQLPPPSLPIGGPDNLLVIYFCIANVMQIL